MAFLADRRKRMFLYTFIGFFILLALGYQYYNFFEEKAVSRFFNTIIAGDYATAYKLWQPPPSYKFSDFLEDWGDQSYYGGGRIISFKLEGSHSRGNFVLIKVLLNEKKEVSLLVNKEDKHLSFAP